MGSDLHFMAKDVSNRRAVILEQLFTKLRASKTGLALLAKQPYKDLVVELDKLKIT